MPDADELLRYILYLTGVYHNDAGELQPYAPVDWELLPKLARALPPPPDEPLPAGPEMLSGAHWVLIFPYPEDHPVTRERLLAMAPLIDTRRAMRGLSVDGPLYFNQDLDGRTFNTIIQWCLAHPMLLEPCNILIVAAGEEISFSLDEVLATSHKVGRLPFADSLALARYASRAARLPVTKASIKSKALTAFCPTGDKPTLVSYAQVAGPLLAKFGEKRHLNLKEYRGLVGLDALSQSLGMAPEGSIWLNSSHGYAPHHPDKDLGAPCDAFGKYLATESLQTLERCIPGGFGLLHSCCGAGRGQEDVSSRPLPGWLWPTLPVRTAPFACGLLAHPVGPCALLAHVDLLFTRPILETSDLERLAQPPFEEANDPLVDALSLVINALYEGETVGDAFASLSILRNLYRVQWMEVSRQFLMKTHPTPVDQVTLINAWLNMRNTCKWVLFGDPLARLYRPEP